MRRALVLACEAESRGEVPVGAVLILDDSEVGCGSNSPIELQDPTAHAELIAIRQGASCIGSYRLPGSVLYSTLEPCPMCAGALVNARVQRLVFGARDIRFGGVRSKFQIADSDLLNHRVEIVEGVLGADCVELLKRFFDQKRR